MQVLSYLLYSITFASLRLVDCDSVCPADATPCKCYPVSQQIVCSGPEVNDAKLAELGKKLITPWKYLYIHETGIVNIAANTFEKADFEKIFIVANTKLTTIAPTAFKKSSLTNSLIIRDNHAFNDPKLFTFVKSLGKSLKKVELDRNAITAIPDHAFDDGATGETERAFKVLEIIRLDDQQPTKNKLTSIGVSSFANLPMLKQLSLDKNKIGSIGAAGIDLSKSALIAPEQHISLFLEDNELTETLITAETIIKPAQTGVSVGLVLNNNKIAHLTKPFVDFISSIAHVNDGKVYLNNQTSAPTCACDNVKSIIDIFKAAGPPLKGSIQGLAETCTGAAVTIGACPA